MRSRKADSHFARERVFGNRAVVVRADVSGVFEPDDKRTVRRFACPLLKQARHSPDQWRERELLARDPLRLLVRELTLALAE